MKPQVEHGVEELRESFPEACVTVRPTDDGGCIVTVDPIDLGPTYTPQETWIKFAISFQYPYADIYPLFIRPDLARADGESHGRVSHWLSSRASQPCRCRGATAV